MKTDSLFCRLFQLSPSIFFELIGQPGSEASDYEFRSIEIKQTSFRIDGVLLPTVGASDRPIYFSEVQFQKDQQLYHRFFAEIFLYLAQNPATYDWQYPHKGAPNYENEPPLNMPWLLSVGGKVIGHATLAFAKISSIYVAWRSSITSMSLPG